jgi:hypothetical protein
MNLDQMTPAAKALAERRGHRQTEPEIRRRGLVLGEEDLSDVLTGFEYDMQRSGMFRGYADLEGASLIDIGRALDETLLLWDGGGVREGRVTGVSVEASRESFGTVRIRLEFEGWA